MTTVDYEEIFEKAEVGIALNDPERGTVGRVNECYSDMMGYGGDELRDMKIEEISAEDPTFDQEAAMEKIQRAIGGTSQRFDWLFERKDGSQFWGEVVLKRTMIGEEDRLLAFVRDISARKRYEQELEQQNQRLDEFASVVSHDLRNPLTNAIGRLELVREDCDSPHIEPLNRALKRMDELIEGVLSLARTGKSVIETEPVDLSAMAEGCWQSIDNGATTLEVKSDTTIPADPQRFRQLLANVFQNVVDHAGADVAVTIGELEDGFYVEDDGPGVPETKRDRIFDVGYTTSPDGTGFGLRIVQQIANAHGWKVSLSEGEAGGARFEFTGVKPG